MGSWEFSPSGNGVVQLPETSTILNLLFRFCYPECRPDLGRLPFDILTGFAEAVEKYKVFSAIGVCRFGMK
jgi:hypothetical protein